MKPMIDERAAASLQSSLRLATPRNNILILP
jgi:hypothetical protein